MWCRNEVNNDAIALLKENEERIKLLEHQLETLTRWRMNAGAFD
jgi:chromosome segregation ATPase